MSLPELIRSRATGDFSIDEWGLDPQVHDAAVRLGRLVWNVRVHGAANLPVDGPALLLVQRRIGLAEGAIVFTGVGFHTSRHVRSVGVPGLSFAEPTLRRTGAAFAHPDEIAGLLRDGHLVSLGLRPALIGTRPGAVDPELVLPALRLGAPILPVGVHGHELARFRTVEIGRRVELPHDGGRLAAVEHVEAARDEIAAMGKAAR